MSKLRWDALSALTLSPKGHCDDFKGPPEPWTECASSCKSHPQVDEQTFSPSFFVLSFQYLFLLFCFLLFRTFLSLEFPNLARRCNCSRHLNARGEPEQVEGGRLLIMELKGKGNFYFSLSSFFSETKWVDMHRRTRPFVQRLSMKGQQHVKGLRKPYHVPSSMDSSSCMRPFDTPPRVSRSLTKESFANCLCSKKNSLNTSRAEKKSCKISCDSDWLRTKVNWQYKRIKGTFKGFVLSPAAWRKDLIQAYSENMNCAWPCHYFQWNTTLWPWWTNYDEELC